VPLAMSASTLITAAIVGVVAFVVVVMRQRTMALESLALSLGLQYRSKNRFDGSATSWAHQVPGLVPEVVRANVSSLISGTWEGREIVFFEAGTFAGVILEVPGVAFPDLVVDGRHGGEQIWSAGLSPFSPEDPQETEWQAFNEAFEVHSDDARFASAFLDARMMVALVELADDATVVRVRDDRLLLAGHIVPAGQVESVYLEPATALVERIPKVVAELYPSA
jgi:hypothetical protein